MTQQQVTATELGAKESSRSALMRIQRTSLEEADDRRHSKRFSVESAKTSSRVGEKTPLVHTTDGTSVVTILPQSLFESKSVTLACVIGCLAMPELK
ncbi:hypothetical protein ANCCEY_13380 [Ancylostoma ceylanicum]|uniref:Uncharacterized protein n=1 Tax=Ancylostoma ceylanicum TaxID=53326 RepID=A0A0D6L7N2_9BILA|nr:hypothetical protein ANCCEY_13380 [Ancylostoma ceylanicum]